jgi:restriction endonuclease S subunit
VNDGITLQELPDAWEYCGLGEFCDFAGGTQPPKSTFKDKSQDGYIRLLQIRDFESEDYAVFIPKQERLRIVQEEDISIGRYGASVGRILTGKAGAINVAIMTTLPDIRRVGKRFLGYSLQLSEFQQYLRGLGGRAAQAGFNRGEVRRFKFPLPPLWEQQKISAVLGLVQRAIEQQERLIALTTELKKALLHKLFTEGLRGEPQKQTEIGPVPESWEVAELGKLVNLFGGYAFRSEDSVAMSNTQLVRMGNLYQNRLDLTRSPIFYPDDFAEQYARFVLKQGDLIMSLTGTSGKEDYGFTVEIKHVPKTLLLNQRVARIDITSSKLVKDFLFYFLLSRKFLNQLYQTAKGMKQANLSTYAMKQLKVPVPGVREQKDIADYFRAIDQRNDIHQRRVDMLHDLFCTLLHQLMTAQIRVHDRDFPELEPEMP